ncbi:MAG: hypothetical protein HYZ15_02490 [Sphingobacteriales bacterium]|nr:hypothetical protein [Sphingobacteriales bacterium]
MQRWLFTFYFLLYAMAGDSQQNRPGFISADEMLEAFCALYKVDNTADEYISFEKRRGDWYVVSNRYENQTGLIPFRKQLFRAVTDTGYRKLSFVNVSGINPLRPESLMDEPTRMNFDIQPYYGYTSWYKDVITDLGGKNPLSDNDLYALGRAYSARAMGYISNNSGFVDEKDTWALPFSINALSREQIEIFRKEGKLALDCFEMLMKRTPDYETVVGKIGMKYANEIMFQYQIFLTYADSFSRSLSLPVDLYRDADLQESKELLSGCPPNAVLLSFGDNDYYPVHYLQKVRGLRTDVFLINYNLMGIDRYIYRTKFPQYKAQSVKMSADTAYYIGNKGDVIYLKDTAVKFAVRDFPFFFDSAPVDELGRQTLKAGSVLLDWRGEKEQIKIPLLGAPYLFKNQWVLLDILNNLDGRKVGMRSQFFDELNGLNKYLEKSGVTWIFGL